jgi:hypothetical protein
MHAPPRLITGLTLLLLSAVVHAQPQPPTLTKATLRTHTDGDDRDHDTAIFVYATEADGKTVLAQLAYGAIGGRYGYPDNFWANLDVPLYQKRPVTKAECVHFKYRIGIQANCNGALCKANWDFKIEDLSLVTFHGGNDTWKFDAWLILTFSDGSTLSADKLRQSMTSSGGKLVLLNLQ